MAILDEQPCVAKRTEIHFLSVEAPSGRGKMFLAFTKPAALRQRFAQARYLSDRTKAEPLLELVAPTSINIVCFRFRPKDVADDALKAINMEIMLRLQEEGIAALSDTTIHGDYCLRVAINNHRTQRLDLDILIAEILRLGTQLRA